MCAEQYCACVECEGWCGCTSVQLGIGGLQDLAFQPRAGDSYQLRVWQLVPGRNVHLQLRCDLRCCFCMRSHCADERNLVPEHPGTALWRASARYYVSTFFDVQRSGVLCVYQELPPNKIIGGIKTSKGNPLLHSLGCLSATMT